MRKSADRQEEILNAALEQASLLGLEALTIGSLAEAVGMSKSGLFAHFSSKENLQIAVLRYAADRYADRVLRPAFEAPRGIARIEALGEAWLDWVRQGLPGGCPFLSAVMEYDDRPGPVREHVYKELARFRQTLVQLCRQTVEAGDFRGDVDVDQWAFDFFSLYLGAHFQIRMLRGGDGATLFRSALQRLIKEYRN
jgi:AcrR family transcriptional regulator